MKEKAQTFGLISERTPMQSYIVTVYHYGRKNGYDAVRSIKAQNIDNLRKNLIGEYKGRESSIEVERIGKKARRFIGTLEVPSVSSISPKWQVPGKNAWTKVDTDTGRLI